MILSATDTHVQLPRYVVPNVNIVFQSGVRLLASRVDSKTAISQIIAGVCLIVACALNSEASRTVNPFAQPDKDVHYERHDSADQQKHAPIEFKLKAVMPSPSRPLANINGQLLAPGDLFNGYTLVSVSTDGVLLRRGERTLTLALRPTPAVPGGSR